jgi:HK97 family phage prohead protease
MPDEATHIQFDSPEVSETFRVNQEKRTISGLAVPWGKVARSGFARWRFAPNSLRWSDARRVKLNLNHNPEQAVGYALGLRNTSEGLDVTFKVAEVPEGDRALALASGGVWDGLSIEVDFEEDGDEGWTPDPSDRNVRLVNQARLRGVALTAMPAYDDARVAAVVATRNTSEEIHMAENDQAKVEEREEVDNSPASPAEMRRFMEMMVDKFGEVNTTQFEHLGNSITSGIVAALERIDDPQDGRQSVRAARFQVEKEQPVYTFDGYGPSLVRDAWKAAMEQDQDAHDRLRRYRAQTEEWARLGHSAKFSGRTSAQFATVTTGNASEIIPPGYRPDLYVDELTQGRPLVNGMSRGMISNAAPFTVPIFGSSSGTTADHVEGVNPTDGSLDFGAKTVSPQAISGKLILTREMVDSGNPAIDQIAFQTMRESYARQTEAKAYAMLNGADGAGGTIDNGFVPSGAQVSTTSGDGGDLLLGIREALALYPFNRFAAPNRAFLSKEATTQLATAVGGDDRPLLPSVGAVNTAGVGNAVTNGWFVDGLAHIPAWAITENTSADADVFTFNQADIWIWESPTLLFRYEEKSGPALIELALFGYFGAHILRPVGLSAIRHTVSG